MQWRGTAWPGAPSLRAPLEAIVSGLPLEHPHYPCGYGIADRRITGGLGVDWKAVHRAPGADTVTSLSLLALLSQALVGFAVQYESRVPFAMLVGVYLDAAFADDAVPLVDVRDTGHADHPDVRFVGGNVGFAEASSRA